ncbi:MAG: hypothetical protein M1831_004371 [Alyxoria varia]|nr:MAG: hypothetical protein M1831_004371 [Alyxoria varia]
MDYFDKPRQPNYAVDVQVAEDLLHHGLKTDESGNPNSVVPSEDLLRAPEPFEPIRTPRKPFHDKSTGNAHARNTSGLSGSNSSSQTNANFSVSSQGSVNLAASSYVEEYNALARLNGLTELTEFDGDEQAESTAETTKASSSRKIWRKIARSSSSKNLDEVLEPRITRKSSFGSFLGKRPKLALNCQSLELLYQYGGVSVAQLPSSHSAVSRAIPTCLAATANYLAENGRNTPGLFRIPGQNTVVQGLYEHYVSQIHFAEKEMGRVWVTVGSPAVPIKIACSIHDVASAFKRFLSDVPGGILGSISLFKALKQVEQLQVAEDQPGGDEYRCKVRLSALAIASLQSTRRIAVITAVFGLLALLKNDESPQLISDETTPLEPKPPEMMSSKALAVVFAPTLLGGLIDKVELQPSHGGTLQHKQIETPRRSFMHPFKTPKHTKTGSHDRTSDIEAGIERNKSAVAIIEFLLKRWEDIVRHIQILEAKMYTHRSSRSIQDLARVDSKSSVWRSQRDSLEGVGVHFPPLRDFDRGLGRQSSDSGGGSLIVCSDNQNHLRPPDGLQNLLRSRNISSQAPYEQEESHQIPSGAESASTNDEYRTADYRFGNPRLDRPRFDRQVLSSRIASNGPPGPPWWDQACTKPISTPKRQNKQFEIPNQRLHSHAQEWSAPSVHHEKRAAQQAVHVQDMAKTVREEGSKVSSELEQSTQRGHAVTAHPPSPSILSCSSAFSPPPPLCTPPPPSMKNGQIDGQHVPRSRTKGRTRSVSLNALDQPRDISEPVVLAATSSEICPDSRMTHASKHPLQLDRYSHYNQSSASHMLNPSSSSAPPQRPTVTTHPASQILKAYHQERSGVNLVERELSSDGSPIRMRITPTRIPQPRQDVSRHSLQRRVSSRPRGGGTPLTGPRVGATARGSQLDEDMHKGRNTNRRLGPRDLTVPNLHDLDGRYPSRRRHPPPGFSFPSEARFNSSASFMNGQARYPSLATAPLPAHPGSSATIKRVDQQHPIARRLVFRAPQLRHHQEQDVGQRHREHPVSASRDADEDGEDALWQQHQNQNSKQQQQRQGSYPRVKVSTLFDKIERLRKDLNECNEENRRLRREMHIMRAVSVGDREKENGRIFFE